MSRSIQSMDFRQLGSEVKWGATISRPKCQGWCCKMLWVAIPWDIDLLVLSFHLFSCEKGGSPAPPRAKHASQRTMLLIQPHLDLGGDLWPWAWSSNKENEAIQAKLFGIQNDLLQNAARKYIACLKFIVMWGGTSVIWKCSWSFFFKETARETLESCCDSTKRRLERTLPSDDLEHKLTSADAKQEKMVGKCLPAFWVRSDVASSLLKIF